MNKFYGFSISHHSLNFDWFFRYLKLFDLLRFNRLSNQLFQRDEFVIYVRFHGHFECLCLQYVNPAKINMCHKIGNLSLNHNIDISLKQLNCYTKVCCCLTFLRFTVVFLLCLSFSQWNIFWSAFERNKWSSCNEWCSFTVVVIVF